MTHPQTPRIIAHRGDSANFPENTIAAFKAALAEPIDGIELDVQLTRDGVPVVFHDRNLKRVAGLNKAIHECSYSELSKLDVGAWFAPQFSGQRIPALQEVLDLIAPHAELLVEIKHRASRNWNFHAAKTIVDRIAGSNHADRCWVLAYDFQILREVSQRSQTIRWVWNTDRPRHQTDDLWLSAYSVHVTGINPEFTTKSHLRTKQVFCFTCNRVEQVQRALAANCDVIMGDDPARLRRLCDDHVRALS